VRNYPYPFIFLGSSTPIALIAPIAPFKPLIFRSFFSDQGIMRGKTLQCASITFIWLKVLIDPGMLADRGKIRGKTPHYAPIAQSIKIRGKTPDYF